MTVIGELHEPLPLTVTILAGLTVAGMLLRIDAASPRRLFPLDAFRLQTLIGLGTWIVILISMAAAVRAIFVTTIGQVLWGLSVTQASYVAALLAFSWSFFAFVSSRAPDRQRELLYLVLGPFLIAGGMGLTALAIDATSLPAFAIAAIVTGAGHGLCNQILMRSLMYGATGGGPEPCVLDPADHLLRRHRHRRRFDGPAGHHDRSRCTRRSNAGHAGRRCPVRCLRLLSECSNRLGARAGHAGAAAPAFPARGRLDPPR